MLYQVLKQKFLEQHRVASLKMKYQVYYYNATKFDRKSIKLIIE